MLRVADSLDAFTTEVRTLLEQPEAAARLGAEGRVLVAAHFSWDVFNQQLEAVLRG